MCCTYNYTADPLLRPVPNYKNLFEPQHVLCSTVLDLLTQFGKDGQSDHARRISIMEQTTTGSKCLTLYPGLLIGTTDSRTTILSLPKTEIGFDHPYTSVFVSDWDQFPLNFLVEQSEVAGKNRMNKNKDGLLLCAMLCYQTLLY